MFYVLKHKSLKDNWCYVGVYTSSNEGSAFCNSTRVEFDVGMEQPYIFIDKSFVENVLSGEYDVSWYNSSVDTPELSGYVRKEIMKNYEIVKLVPAS